LVSAVPAQAGTHAEAAAMFFVYLLAGKPHETLYVGSTSDLVRKEHKGRHRRSGFFSYAALAD